MPSSFSRSLFLAFSLLFLSSMQAFGAETANQPDASIQLRYEQAHMAVNNKHYHEAFNRFSQLADEGHPAAQHVVGVMYEKGIGVKKDLKKAVVYYRKAADQDFGDAQSALGHMYLVGNAALYKDASQAKEWLTKAAAKEVPQAEYTLGMLHADGDKIPQDLQKAAQYLRSAASHGIAEAELALAKLPPLPYIQAPGGGNALGAPGQAYGKGLNSIKDSWSGYGDLLKSLNNVNGNQ
jgi:TPR repeat protein